MAGAVGAAIVGDALGTVGASIVGGAVIGGGVAAVTGGDVVQGAAGGALMGGIGGAIGEGVSALSGAASGAGTAVEGAAGATMTGEQVGSAVQAYMDSGYDYNTATQMVAQATGNSADAVMNAEMNGAAMQVADGAPFTTSGGIMPGLTQAAQNQLASKLGNLVLGAGQKAVQTGVGIQGAQQATQQSTEGLQKASDTLANAFTAQQAVQAPYEQAGITALNRLSTGMQAGGEFAKPFSAADMTNVMPAYTFTRDQALDAMNKQLAMGGQQMSTNAVQGAGTLASGLASRFEDQAFNQWLANNQYQTGNLKSLVNTGQTAANTITDALGNTGINQANIQQSIGATKAAGTAATTNIANQGIGQIGDIVQQGKTLASILGQNPVSTTAPAPVQTAAAGPVTDVPPQYQMELPSQPYTPPADLTDFYG